MFLLWLEASEVWLNSVKSLTAAIAGFTNVLDPKVAVISGGIARAGDDLDNSAAQHLRTNAADRERASQRLELKAWWGGK